MLPTDAPLPTLTISLFTLKPQDRTAPTNPPPPAGEAVPDTDAICDYWIQLQFDDPLYPEKQESLNQLVTINYQNLGKVSWEPRLYGSLLANALFTQPAVHQYFSDAWHSAFRTARGLRLVLNLDPLAPELHSLRWETLCHPETNKFLFTDSNLPFSRYLEKRDAGDWRPYELAPRDELSALVAVASPNDLGDGLELGSGPKLMPVDVKGEISRARKSLHPIQKIAVLASRSGTPKKVTLVNLEAELAKGCDILYLACHGALLPDDSDPQHRLAPFLLLEKENGGYHRLNAGILVDFLAGLEPQNRPRLIVLASCQSAGDGSTRDGGALAALGPRLAQAGIPAVIAMQSNIKMATVEQFIPAFFKELLIDGQIERAMAMARNMANGARCDDWWSPVLFTRLRDGRLLPNITASSDALENYLNIASQRLQFSRSVNRRLEILWNEPYKGHLLDQPTRKPEELARIIEEQVSSVSSDRYQRAVLLGSNGQGKTTAMKWLRANQAARALKALKKIRVDKENLEIIPIYFSLNDLSQDRSVQDLALDSVNTLLEQVGAEKIKSKDFEKWASDRRLLFLIDDLEALITWRFGVGLEALSYFMSDRRFSKHQYLIACRSSSYQSQLGAVTLIMLDDLDDEQVMKVLQKNYKDISPQMKKLARNRSVLRLIVEVQGQKLQTKGQLMKLWVERSLDLQGERVEEMDTALIKTLLEQIAFEMRRKHTHAFKEEELMVLINTYLNTQRDLYNWRDVLHCMRIIGALVRDPAGRQYSFTERGYADYFSAAAVINDPDRRTYVLNTASDYWWRDMLEIQVGLEHKPADLLYELIDRDVRSAANCIEFSGIKQSSPVYSALIDGLVAYMEHEGSARRRAMVERINESDHGRVPEVLLRKLHREWSSTVISAIVEGLEKNKRRFSPDELVKIEMKVIDSMAQDSISYEQWLQVPIPRLEDDEDLEWQKAPGAQTITEDEYIQKMQTLLSDISLAPKVRGLAAISLGLTHRPEMLAYLLKYLTDRTMDDHVAWCLAEALTEYKDSFLTSQICAMYDPADGEITPRQKARFIYLLGWSSISASSAQEVLPCVPGTQRDLLMKALSDPFPIVRGYAIQTLTRLGYRDSREIVQNLLKREKDAMVMRKAAEALAQIGMPDSIKLLESKIKDVHAQENQMVRSAYRNAIREIQERYGI